MNAPSFFNAAARGVFYAHMANGIDCRGDLCYTVSRETLAGNAGFSKRWRKDGQMIDHIEIRGARVHNLKNIDVDIPRNELPLHLVFSPLFVPPRRFAGRARHCTISCSTVSIYAFLRFVKRFCKFFRQTWLCQPAGHEKAAAGAAARHTARRNAVRKAYSRGAEKIPFCTAFAGASRRRRRTARRPHPRFASSAKARASNASWSLASTRKPSGS